MNEINEHVERLIVRRLDGELSAAEQLELDRELIRDPAARALYERYAAIDTLAGRVLARCATPRTPVVAMTGAGRGALGGRDHARAWWMIAGAAAAACLAVVVLVKTPIAPQTATGPRDPGGRTLAHPYSTQVPQVTPVRGEDVGVWQVPAGSIPQVDRSTQRNLILVPAADGSYYLLNLDQIHEVQQKSPAGRRVPPGDPI
jgi:anti-sigma factor RsiW